MVGVVGCSFLKPLSEGVCGRKSWNFVLLELGLAPGGLTYSAKDSYFKVVWAANPERGYVQVKKAGIKSARLIIEVTAKASANYKEHVNKLVEKLETKFKTPCTLEDLKASARSWRAAMME